MSCPLSFFSFERLTMKKFLKLPIVHLYYVFMVSLFASMGLIALGWKYGNTAEGRATLIVFAWWGLASSIGTFAIMMTMWVKKWPKTVSYFDIGIGIAGLGYGVWLIAKILWPTYMGYNVHGIFFNFVAFLALAGVACAMKFRADSQRQPARK